MIGLDDLVTLWSTTTSLYGDEIPTSDLGTTLTTSIVSGMLNSAQPNNIIYSSAAREYVSSMSDEEIDDLLLRIDDKEYEIVYDNDFQQKNVKKLTLKNNGKNVNKSI